MKTNNFFLILLFLFFCKCSNEKKDEEVSEEELNPIERELEEGCKYELTMIPGSCFPEVCDKYVYHLPSVEELAEANRILPEGSIANLRVDGGTLKFSQLPDTILKIISTPGLIDALIHAPLFVTISNNLTNLTTLQWWPFVYYSLNSGRELLQRKDAADALVAYYQLVCLDCFKTLIGVEPWVQSKISFYELYLSRRIDGLECLFTKQEILTQMGHEQKQEAVAALLINVYRESFSDGIQPGIFPIVYLLLSAEYEPIVKYAQDHDKSFNLS